MIHAALSHLTSQLNQFLARGLGVSEDIVVLSSLLEQDGSPAPNVANKLVLFVANIAKDATPVSMATTRDGTASALRQYPPLHLNLYVMLAACFGGSNYPQALKLISAAVLFFQKNPVFDRQSTPDLDRRIDKLILEIENLGIQDLSNIWGVAGGRYLPSVLYKLRMVTFDSQDIQALEPTILRPESGVGR